MAERPISRAGENGKISVQELVSRITSQGDMFGNQLGIIAEIVLYKFRDRASPICASPSPG
jgi:hypothetical protein